MVILRSIKVALFSQGIRPLLIILQLVTGFISLTVGLGLIEGTETYIKEVKKISTTDTLRINIYDHHTTLTTKNLNELEGYIKDQPSVKVFGSFLTQQIAFNEFVNNPKLKGKDNIRQGKVYVNFLDDNFFSIANLKIAKGRSLTKKDFLIKENNEIPVLIGNSLAQQYPIGSKLTGGIPDNSKLMIVPKRFIVVGVLDKNTIFWKGNSTSLQDAILEDDSVVISPMLDEFNYGDALLNRMAINSFLKLNENSDITEIKENIINKMDKLGLKGHVSTISEQIVELRSLNRIITLFTISLSSILFLLTTFGLLGVVLASIVRRNKEFGVRFALGATIESLIILVSSEVFSLITISAAIGTTIGLIITSFWPDELLFKFDSISFFYSAAIIISLSFISLIFPLYRVYKLQPIRLIKGE